MERFAVIDIGSNAIRAVVGYVNEKGKLKREFKVREPVRLGADAFSGNQSISEENLLKTVLAFRKFKRHFQEFPISKVRAVATSAVRDAKNADWFLQQIKNETGISVEVIDGFEEARLIHSAVVTKVELLGNRAMLMDIGGGSVEFAFCENNRIMQVESFKIGTLRLLDRFGRTKINNEDIRDAIANIDQGDLAHLLSENLCDIFVGTGGNVEYLETLQENILQIPSQGSISKENLEEITKHLFSLSYYERVENLGMRPDRADVILPAAAICLVCLEKLKLKEMLIPRVGLREGALAELMN